MEETRKMKRGVEETRAEHSEEKQAIGFQSWLMSPIETNYNTEIS